MSSSISPITFSGTSSFSSSFQQVLQRAVGIASLPLTLMQNSVQDLQGQQAALSSLQANFSSLQFALQGVANSGTGTKLTNVSNGAVVSATASSGALPGTYTIEVDDIGSSTSTISNPTIPAVTDPTAASINGALNFTLTVNGTPHDITVTDHSMLSLANAINTSGNGVQATVVNLGSNSSPDYRLSVTSSNLGADTIQLSAGVTDLLSELHSGTNAQYKVNGNSTVLQSTSHQVTLAPGLTVNMLSSASGQPVTIGVTNSFSSLSSALSSLAQAYNSAVDAVGNNRGQGTGALNGQGIVLSLASTLSLMTQYGAGTGSVQSLADLGLTLDSTGHLSFDTSVFNSQSPANVQQFLGGIKSGGFLQYASDTLSSVADPTSGALANQISTAKAELETENSRIADEQTRISALQDNLQSQLVAADAAIAVLEQQKTFMTDLFAATYLNNNNGSGSSK